MCGSGAGGGETEALRALAVAKMDVLSTSSSNGFFGVSSKGFLDEPAIAFGLSSACACVGGVTVRKRVIMRGRHRICTARELPTKYVQYEAQQLNY